MRIRVVFVQKCAIDDIGGRGDAQPTFPPTKRHEAA
jgi:hypothetical protein